jgi:cytochrome c
MKKAIVLAASFALGTAAAGLAFASEDLAKKSGCMTCHDVSAKKMGPSFKDISKKYKGNAEAEKKLVATLAEGKKHPATKVSDADRATLVKWVLAQ